MNRLLDCCELALKQDMPAELNELKSQYKVLRGQKSFFKKLFLVSFVLLMAVALKEINEQLKQRR